MAFKHNGDLSKRIVGVDEPHIFWNKLQSGWLPQKLCNYFILGLSVEDFVVFWIIYEDDVSQKRREQSK